MRSTFILISSQKTKTNYRSVNVKRSAPLYAERDFAKRKLYLLFIKNDRVNEFFGIYNNLSSVHGNKLNCMRKKQLKMHYSHNNKMIVCLLLPQWK